MLGLYLLTHVTASSLSWNLVYIGSKRRDQLVSFRWWKASSLLNKQFGPESSDVGLSAEFGEEKQKRCRVWTGRTVQANRRIALRQFSKRHSLVPRSLELHYATCSMLYNIISTQP